MQIEDSDCCSVGLLLHSNHEHLRQIAMGAVEYHRANPSFRIVGDGSNPLLSWHRLDRFNGDGLIAVAEDQAEIDALKKCGLPFVLCGARFLESDLSVVVSDNYEIGKMAAKHLMSCGIERFLFAGSLKWDDEKLRLMGFEETILAQSHKCEIGNLEDFASGAAKGLEPPDLAPVRSLLQNRTRFPLGVFCPNTVTARATMMACQSLGFNVPDQVAIVAVNDDPILCETSEPPMTTIVQRSRRIGFLAAQVVYNKLVGTPPPQQHIFVAPSRLSIRRSSDVLLVGNPDVESALRFMRDNAGSSIEIQDVANHAGVSRRSLEMKFRETIDATPRESLLKMRLEIAKSLLHESEIPITQIALRSGFGSSQVFSSVFKKECGTTPSQFRVRAESNLKEN